MDVPTYFPDFKTTIKDIITAKQLRTFEILSFLFDSEFLSSLYKEFLIVKSIS